MKKHTIDATDKKIGRVATEVATILMGKDAPSYQPNVCPDVTVEIVNASKASISEKKKEQKTYSQFSGYPGGLKQPTLAQVIEKKGFSEVFRKAVYGMLPDNRLRARMMKNVVISE
tara:strand:- start:188 stop:535 length:348 start_codon:yes stop_codon:yes gene_type:complete